ncbi:MAG: hypothetical protein CBB92_11205 [Flammeovirgaceae bacterium TMED32]|nr:MAG: hypothetical protein CBB92_11205 [Flammeovirgaceae bacterium TMED32]
MCANRALPSPGAGEVVDHRSNKTTTSKAPGVTPGGFFVLEFSFPGRERGMAIATINPADVDDEQRRRLAKNPGRLTAVAFFTAALVFFPVIVPFFQSLGLSMTDFSF